MVKIQPFTKPGFSVPVLILVAALGTGMFPATRTGVGVMDLKLLAAHYGFPAAATSTDTLALKSAYTTMVFRRESRRLLFNNYVVWLNNAPSVSKNTWALSRTDAINVIDPLLRSGKTLASADTSLVLLDPGHGGTDSGAIGKQGHREKDAVLNIARMVQAKLAKSGVKAKLTRTGDSELSLANRCRKAKAMRASLFVSIHLNSAPNKAASGIETFVLSAPGCASTSSTSVDKRTYPGNRFDSRSMVLAYFIHKGALDQSKGTDRGIKRARFLVLRNAPCPAVLLECGFLSNAAEAAKLATEKHQARLAEGIARGILTYVTRARTGS